MSGTQNRLTITDAEGNYHFDDVEDERLLRRDAFAGQL